MSIIKEMDKYINLIDIELKKILMMRNSFNGKIYDAMEYSLFTGGKRLRPIMALKTFELFNNDLKRIIPYAIGIEMIHTYSLIHDDLPSMDNDDFRRGKPTNHKVFGEAMAILAGDGLLNLAFETMSNHMSQNAKSLEDYKCYVRAMNEISKYSGCTGMIGGQVLDLMSSYDNMEEEKLIYMYKSKTAALIQASFVTGAIIGGASEFEIDTLAEVGLNLGLAYQIKDDILDAHQDNIINKFTYLKYHNLETSIKKVGVLSKKAIEGLDSLKDKDTEFLKNLAHYLIDRDL